MNIHLERQLALDVSNTRSWLIKNLIISGLSNDPAMEHYIRQSTQDLWNLLNGNHEPHTRILINGCPGVGKSTTLFGWLMSRATSRRGRSSFLWIHFENDDGDYSIIFNKKSEALSQVYNWSGSLNSFDISAIKRLCKEEDFDLVILDGKVPRRLMTMNVPAHTLVILCTSYQSLVFNTSEYDK